MTEILVGLFALCFGFAIWAVLGHVMWLVAEGIIKGIFGSRCTECNRKHLSSTHCPYCASTLAQSVPTRAKADLQNPTPKDDLFAARRLLGLSKLNQWLSENQHTTLQQLLDALTTALSSGRATDSLDEDTIGNASHLDQQIHLHPEPDHSRLAAPQNVAPLQDSKPPEKVDSDQKKPIPADSGIVTATIVSKPTEILATNTSESPLAHAPPHALDQTYQESSPAPTVAPIKQRITADVLRSFMQQSNIRWIELISAALIVVCSVGLVISLWSTLSETSRFFPSLVFLLATIAVHGAGQYTLRQWKLRTTSRGVLHIALMLIPLSVLVGILLAHRSNEPPPMDVFTGAVIGAGTMIYGALAVTASSALFVRRWMISSAATILGSLSLIPIYILGQAHELGRGLAALTLAPLIAVGMWAAISTGQSLTRRFSLSDRSARTHAGIMTQTVFAILVSFVFWILQTKGSGVLSQWWWLSAGIIAAVLASWGWSTCVPKSDLSTGGTRIARPSWLVVGGWFLAAICSVFLVACVWQVAMHRSFIASMLLVLAAWWLVHSWQCDFKASAFASGIATTVGITFALETVYSPNAMALPLDWISFGRIVTLTTVGLIATVLSVAAEYWLRRTPNTTAHVGYFGRRTTSTASLLQQYTNAGALSVGVAALLTVLASLLPFGETPFGGNWAALMLITYGSIAIASAILANWQRWFSVQVANILMPIGQATMLLGTVRLCQSSDLLEPLLGSLRPERAWAVGALVVAMVWSIIAAVIRNTLNSAFQIRWLCSGAVAVGLCGAIAIWTRPDQLLLASIMGWTVPITTAALFVAWREAAWRESTLLTTCVWASSMLYWYGNKNEFWIAQGLSVSASAFVMLVALLAIAFEYSLHRVNLAFCSDEDNGDAERNARWQWLAAGPYWASSIVVFLAWGALLLAVLAPSSSQISIHLGASSGDMSSRNENRAVSEFLFAGVQTKGALWLLLVGAVVASTSAFIGRLRNQRVLTTSIALVPVFCAMVFASWIGFPNALSAALWTLAAWILASECLRYAPESLASVSRSCWNDVVTGSWLLDRKSSWLTAGRTLTLGLLAAGSVAIVITTLTKNPNTLASLKLTSTTELLIVLGPLLSVGIVRWAISLWEGEQPQWIALSACVAAITTGCVAGLSVEATPRTPSVAIEFLRITTIFAAGLAWLTVCFPIGRNALGLRRMLGASTRFREILPRALRGARWKKCEQASWNTLTVSVVLITTLCCIAAIAVLSFPAKSVPVLSQLGSPTAHCAFLLTTSLFCFLSYRRGTSRFALLAVVLGLFAPLAAASYAGWLAADISRRFIGAAGFEPVRFLDTTWILVLAVGLCVRISAESRGKELSWIGQFAWVMVACVVAAISLVSTYSDPNPWWAFGELSALAMLAVLSSAASGQSWRGHLAALAASAALTGWLFQPGPKELPEQIWLLLLGPVWVGFVALGWKLFLRPKPAEDGHRGTFLQRITIDQTASICAPIASLFFSFIWLVVQRRSMQPPTSFTWLVLGLVVASLALAVARLWDSQAGKRGLSVYLNMLAVCACLCLSLCALGHMPKLETLLLWMISLLGAMAIMAGLLRELLRESSRLGPAFKIGAITSDPAQYRRVLNWMPTAHTVAALLALLPSVALVLVLENRPMRIAATVLPLLGSLSILPIANQQSRILFRYVGLFLVSVTLILLWWADLPQAWSATSPNQWWLYIQRVFAALMTLAIIYPILASTIKRQLWEKPLMHFGWLTLLFGASTGCILLIGQFTGEWTTAASQASHATKLMTIAAWALLAGRLLQFAAKPTSTDKRATIPLRKAAVYGAELSLAAFSAATYFSYPDLFSGLLTNWWPMVMFAIAILSAGLGEWLRRIEQPIISDPVYQSSLILPIIPLAGVWLVSPNSMELIWSDWDYYSLLLIVAAGLYGVHGWLRESVGLRILSGSLVLASFWSLLYSQPDLRFFEHPQFWLLPPALASLAFAEFNRKRLEPAALVATRYISILVAYLSSTAEIFLKAFEGQLWQPILLLALALCGVAAGILLRVRAFLFCGSTFTFVALLGMVWHAQQAIGQVWPWWAFGIATGVSLIVLLGYFEKNRPAVLAYIERVKNWQG